MFFIICCFAFSNFCYANNNNTLGKYPIYALEDGEVDYETWVDVDIENTEVMDFRKNYKDCMADELAVFKSEGECIRSISMTLAPNRDQCIEYYYEVMETVNKTYGVSVKKGDLIAYTNTKERTKPTIRKRNFRGCK